MHTSAKTKSASMARATNANQRAVYSHFNACVEYNGNRNAVSWYDNTDAIKLPPKLQDLDYFSTIGFAIEGLEGIDLRGKP